MKASSGAPSPFGLGSAIFGHSESSTPQDTKEGNDSEDVSTEDDTSDEDNEGSEDEQDESLVTALATTTLESSPWVSTPAYDTLYLSTIAEYIPPASKATIPKEAQAVEDDEQGGKSKDTTWATEGYENSLEVDHTFERFSQRVGYEGEQCLRYVSHGRGFPWR
jgi:pre-rRNA-processing protein TSR4